MTIPIWAHLPTSGTAQGSTEDFIPGAHKSSPQPTKQGSLPFKTCSKREKAAPSMTMSKEERKKHLNLEDPELTST